jgi:hypothetical protein
MKDDWKTICTILMVVATGTVIYGALPSFMGITGSNEFGLHRFLLVLIWMHGLIGIALCYLEDAAFKKPLGAISLSATVIAVSWNLAHTSDTWAADPNYPFDADGSTLFLLFCLATGATLAIRDRNASRTMADESPGANWVVHIFMALWILATFFLFVFIGLR